MSEVMPESLIKITTFLNYIKAMFKPSKMGQLVKTKIQKDPSGVYNSSEHFSPSKTSVYFAELLVLKCWSVWKEKQHNAIAVHNGNILWTSLFFHAELSCE